MFEQGGALLSDVVIRVRNKEKENVFIMNIPLSQNGSVYTPDILRRIREVFDYPDHTLFFYFDHLQQREVSLQGDEECFVSHPSLINENMISLRYETQLSDEIRANPELKNQNARSRRSPERFLYEAFEVMETWRRLYREGTFNQTGEREKMTLDKAANTMGIPRKTLEDYYLLFRNGLAYQFDFATNSRKKIGVLRAYVKEKRKQKVIPSASLSSIEETTMLSCLRREILGWTQKQMEEELFKVVESRNGNEKAGSDEEMAEDLIFEN